MSKCWRIWNLNAMKPSAIIGTGSTELTAINENKK